MVRFRIRNAEEREHLKELVESGIVGVLDMWSPAERFPKYYVYFESDVSVRGVSQFTYERFGESEEVSFIQFCQLLISQGVV